ncbi:unnamed protein product [Boreogadus saida]
MESFSETQWLCSRPTSSERLFMVHGQAAHRTDYTRVSECVALKLFKEFKEGRNRPKDPKGRTFAIPQSIVMTLQDRQKRADRDSLLQGVELPQQVHVAEESLLEALDLPSEPVPHGHADLEFGEPDNREELVPIPTTVSSSVSISWLVPIPAASNTVVSVSGLGLLPTASSLLHSGLVGALIPAATTTSSPLSELVLKPAATTTSSSSLSGLLPAATSARFSTSGRTF